MRGGGRYGEGRGTSRWILTKKKKKKRGHSRQHETMVSERRAGKPYAPCPSSCPRRVSLTDRDARPRAHAGSYHPARPQQCHVREESGLVAGDGEQRRPSFWLKSWKRQRRIGSAGKTSRDLKLPTGRRPQCIHGTVPHVAGASGRRGSATGAASACMDGRRGSGWTVLRENA